MGLLGFLVFAFKCIDFLAWPMFSLGYPLYASIQAIESNSILGMRNLVAYWIIFSLISFFELVFGKLLQWLPFWVYIKLMTICFLVLPQFDGACYAYEQLVRPFLSFNLEVVVKKFIKPKKGPQLRAESFLAVAEKYVKENGSEELEQLIAQKSNDSKPSVDTEVIKAVTNAEEKETAAPICLKEHSTAKECAEEPTGKNPAAETKSPKSEEHNVTNENAKAKEPKEKNPAALPQVVKQIVPNVAETAPKAAAAEKLKQETQKTKQEMVRAQDKACEVPTSDKIQKKWACALCQVTTTCEKNLNSHLWGRKHQARYKELIANKQGSKNKDGSSTPNQEPNTSNLNKNKNKKQEEKVPESIKSNSCATASQNKTTNQKQKDEVQEAPSSSSGNTAKQNKTKKEKVKVGVKQKEAKNSGASGMGSSPLWCSLCNVWCPGETDMASHLLGKKHLTRVQAVPDC